jgi:hypothetical protein
MFRTLARVAAPAAALALASSALAANHREAPITALDHKADITDVYAFVSYGPDQQPGTPPSKVTMILAVDPLLEPANGPTLFPFDPAILYEIKVDNNNDALADVTFQFRFSTEYRLPTIYTAVAGFGDTGASDPDTGEPVVPPQIRSFDDAGLNLRQSYTVLMKTRTSTQVFSPPGGGVFRVVPGNAGPRTMDYPMLFEEGTYELANGLSVFAGTTDDAFWIDLGAAFDTASFRTLGSGVPGVLTDAEEMADSNAASDTVSGYAVNHIAIEVPIQLLTRTGRLEPADSTAATLGVWGTTSRQRVTIRRAPLPAANSSTFSQVQRMGHPLINELVIGIGSKDRFSMDQPRNDAQFADFFLDPPIVHIVEALYGGALETPDPPRTDLLPLVTYAPPIAAPGTPAGPIADLLRLNVGVPATPPAMASRMGVLGGDGAGYPNGRRVFDDVTDIVLRVAVGGVLYPGFDMFPNNKLGDGVNVNDTPYFDEFPYVGYCPDGRNRRHVDPGEPGGGPVD